MDTKSFDASGLISAARKMERDLESQNEYRKKKDIALLNTADALREMQAMMELEMSARIESEKRYAMLEKKDSKRFLINLIISVVAAVAAILAVAVPIILEALAHTR